MGDSHQEGSPFTGRGHDLSPLLGVVEAVGVEAEAASVLSSSNLELLQWGNCTPWSWDSWCGDCQLDPVNCPFGTVLEFLLARFYAGLAHSTLKVYVADILVYLAPRPSYNFESSDLPSPLGAKAHSTHGMAASKAFLVLQCCRVVHAPNVRQVLDKDLRATLGSSVLLP